MCNSLADLAESVSVGYLLFGGLYQSDDSEVLVSFGARFVHVHYSRVNTYPFSLTVK